MKKISHARGTALPRYLLVVEARVAEAVEDDWNRWYDEVHLPEITDCPGFIRSGRYVAEHAGDRRYLTLYELESEDAVHTSEFSARRGWGRFAGQLEASVRLYVRRTPPLAEEAR